MDDRDRAADRRSPTDTSPEHLTRRTRQQQTGLRPQAGLPLRGAARPVCSRPVRLIVGTEKGEITGPRGSNRQDCARKRACPCGALRGLSVPAPCA